MYLITFSISANNLRVFVTAMYIYMYILNKSWNEELPKMSTLRNISYVGLFPFFSRPSPFINVHIYSHTCIYVLAIVSRIIFCYITPFINCFANSNTYVVYHAGSNFQWVQPFIIIFKAVFLYCYYPASTPGGTCLQRVISTTRVTPRTERL